MIDLRYLARLLNKAQREGHEIGIVSWLSKSGTPEYNEGSPPSKSAVGWLLICPLSIGTRYIW